MGKMKDALIELAKKVTGKELKNTNSLSNVLKELADGYKVEEQKLYKHKISFRDNSLGVIVVEVLTKDNTLFTQETFTQYLYENYSYTNSTPETGGFLPVANVLMTRTTSESIDEITISNVVGIAANSSSIWVLYRQFKFKVDSQLTITEISQPTVVSKNYKLIGGLLSIVYNTFKDTVIEL